MESALIISDSQKAASFYQDFLKNNGYSEFVQCGSGEEAKRMLMEKDFGVCILNTPIRGAAGDKLAIQLAEQNNCQVIVFVKTEFYESVSERVENYGVITLEKPISRKLFWSALKITRVMEARMASMHNEVRKLQKKLNEQKEISRAKCLLIEKANMTEEEAHKYIEKNAMNERVSRKEIAVKIIEFYG